MQPYGPWHGIDIPPGVWQAHSPSPGGTGCPSVPASGRTALAPDPAPRQSSCAPARRAGGSSARDRFALIVDADDYFAHAKAAMLAARHSIYLIGWDFDTRITSRHRTRRARRPDRLGNFLALVRRATPDLQSTCSSGISARSTRSGAADCRCSGQLVGTARLHFRLDGAHPLGSAHHQKIVVIDDALAFCGGIDMTIDRWDTREHRARTTRAASAPRQALRPWHDATTAVDGDAARALGELARERWQRATGTACRVAARDGPTPGRTALAADCATSTSRIARTVPGLWRPAGGARGRDAVPRQRSPARSASSTSRASTSPRGASPRRSPRRLGEPDGPEFVIVNPRTATAGSRRRRWAGPRRAAPALRRGRPPRAPPHLLRP